MWSWFCWPDITTMSEKSWLCRDSVWFGLLCRTAILQSQLFLFPQATRAKLVRIRAYSFHCGITWNYWYRNQKVEKLSSMCQKYTVFYVSENLKSQLVFGDLSDPTVKLRVSGEFVRCRNINSRLVLSVNQLIMPCALSLLLFERRIAAPFAVRNFLPFGKLFLTNLDSTESQKLSIFLLKSFRAETFCHFCSNNYSNLG